METAKPKKEKVVKPKIELVSYSIKMTIPTAQYANIIPEIVVKAGTVEEAHDYIAPHFNKLWKEYYLVSERRLEPAQPQQAPTPVAPQPPASSVAFTKASQAIASCLSLEALDIISNQVGVSVKLTPEDKEKLHPLIMNKFAELRVNQDEKVNPA